MKSSKTLYLLYVMSFYYIKHKKKNLKFFKLFYLKVFTAKSIYDIIKIVKERRCRNERTEDSNEHLFGVQF